MDENDENCDLLAELEDPGVVFDIEWGDCFLGFCSSSYVIASVHIHNIYSIERAVGAEVVLPKVATVCNKPLYMVCVCAGTDACLRS